MKYIRLPSPHFIRFYAILNLKNLKMHTTEEEFENHLVSKSENFKKVSKNMKKDHCCKLIEWTFHLGLLFISGYFVR